MSNYKLTTEELAELGITRTFIPGRSRTAYIYSCATCGRPVTKFALILDRPIYCGICQTDAKKKIELAKKEAERRELLLNSLDLGDAKKKQMFSKAEEIMRKIGGYSEGIEKARLAYEKFDSAPEAIAAIILLQLGYRVIAQQRVSDYKVDFALPDEKVVIEIDGALYHKDVNKREIRDFCIKYNLGDDWDIIHVPAEALMKRPKEFSRMIHARLQKRKTPSE